MAPNGNNSGNNNDEHYDTQDYSGDNENPYGQWLPGLEELARHSAIATQSGELSDDVRMGDDRVIGNVPNWDGFSSQQLYAFATTDNAPDTADSLGRAFNDGGNRLAEAANGLFEAVTAIEGAWTGTASDSARGALAPLAKAAGQAGQTAQMMGVQMSRQSTAAAAVRELPPPREFDAGQALRAGMAGGPAAMQADLKAQDEAAKEVKREQIRYLQAYTKAMSEVDAQTPSFVPPPTGRIKPTAGGSGSVHGALVQIPQTGDGSSGGGTSTGGPTGGYVGVNPGGQAGHPGSNGPGFASEEIDDLTIPGTLPGTSASGYTPTSAPPVAPGTGPAFGPSAGGPSMPAAGAGGFGGAFGNFGGTGVGGPGGTGAGGGAPAPGQGPAARGLGPGMAPGGGRGMGPGGGMGAGGRRAEGEDDDEHDRPAYLVEGDPDSAFGNDQVSAPSVIGGDDDGA